MPRLPLLLLTLVLLLSIVARAQAGSVLPIEIANNLPFVEAEVDGRRGWFFFDTGAPGLALNAARFPDRQATGTPGPVSAGATGAHTGAQTPVARFALGPAVQENITAGLINLSHLERATGREVLGLIGQANLQADVVYFDYAAKQIRLLPRAGLGHLPAARIAIPFTMDRHLPMFTARLGDQVVKLAVDSGAAGGMLDAGRADQLKPHLQLQGAAALHGVGGSSAGQIERFTGAVEVEGAQFTGLVFLFMPMGHFRAQGATFDGVIGYHLLAPRPSAIDYAGKRLLFW